MNKIENVALDIFYKFSTGVYESSQYYYRSRIRDSAYINEYDRDRNNLRYVISSSAVYDSTHVMVVLDNYEIIIKNNSVFIFEPDEFRNFNIDTKEDYFNASLVLNISVSFDFVCKIKEHLITLQNKNNYVIFMPDIEHEFNK